MGRSPPRRPARPSRAVAAAANGRQASTTRGGDVIAETAEKPEERTDQVEPENNAVWIVIVALLVLLVAGYAIAQSLKSTPSAIITGTRAVVVPTNDGQFTVVVAPCGTGTSATSSDVGAIRQAAGSTTIQLPKGQGDRIVLVPACTAGHGGTSGTSPLPSAAFVPPAGVSLPPIGTGKTTTTPEAGSLVSAQYELTVPAGSPIRTVVVGPCEKAPSSTPGQELLTPIGSSSTAVAPAC
jgi:hypothetical protein